MIDSRKGCSVFCLRIFVLVKMDDGCIQRSEQKKKCEKPLLAEGVTEQCSIGTNLLVCQLKGLAAAAVAALNL